MAPRARWSHDLSREFPIRARMCQLQCCLVGVARIAALAAAVRLSLLARLLVILMSSSSLVACLLACIVFSFSITLTSSNSMVALLLVFIVYSFVDVTGRSPHRQ